MGMLKLLSLHVMHYSIFFSLSKFWSNGHQYITKSTLKQYLTSVCLNLKDDQYDILWNRYRLFMFSQYLAKIVVGAGLIRNAMDG